MRRVVQVGFVALIICLPLTLLAQTAQEKSLAQSRIKSLERRLASKQAAKKLPEKSPPIVAPAPTTPAADRTAPITPAPDTQPAPGTEDVKETGAGRSWRWKAGWAGVGVGGAALVTGIVFGFLALSKNADYDELKDSSGIYEDLIEVQQTGESYESAQIALMALGPIIAAAGGALLIWEKVGQRDELSSNRVIIAPVVMKGGVGFSGSLSF